MYDYECLNCGEESLVVVGVPRGQRTGEPAQLDPLRRMLLPRFFFRHPSIQDRQHDKCQCR